MLTSDDWKELSGFGSVVKEKHSGWFRYLVGLGAGALTVMVAFGKGIQAGLPGYEQRVALISLPLGILAGSFCAYAEVLQLLRHWDNLVAQKTRLMAGYERIDAPSVVGKTPFLKICEKLCYLAFLISLGAMVVFAWTLPPS